jgi:Ca2+-binding RTX toxin-like protein
MANIYNGTSGNDFADGVWDELYGLDGNDTLKSSKAGFVKAYGGLGSDKIYLTHATGWGQLYGGGDNDFIYGGAGIDLLTGDAGDDGLYGGDGGGTLWGGTGIDVLQGGVGGVDTFYGGTESDYISGEVVDPNRAPSVVANDYMSGEDGADALYGVDGNDTIYGGNGDDQGGLFTAIASRVREDVYFGLYGGAGNDYLDGGSGADHLDGGSGNDTMYGGSLDYADTLVGGAGLDSLYGGGGGDVLDGRDGEEDLLSGGAGGDTYKPDGGSQWSDTIVEAAGGGYDYLYASGTYSLNLNAEVENLSFADPNGVAAMSLGGSDTNNWIFGNQGSNTLDGRGGNDVVMGAGGVDYLYGGNGADHLEGGIDGVQDILTGGAGNDTYIVESGDLVEEDAGGGTDAIYTTGSYEMAVDAQIEYLGLLHPEALVSSTLIGSSVDNVIVGGNGGDWLSGKGGSDTLYGSDGNDTLLGNDGADALVGGLGNDHLWGHDGGDTLTGGGGEDHFRMSSILDSPDMIMDFESGVDEFWLGQGSHYYFESENYAPNYDFTLGTAATQRPAQLIYDQSTGVLWFDIDGNGATEQHVLAYFVNKPVLSGSDFIAE